jgi:outer membrane protein assembly factor BamB
MRRFRLTAAVLVVMLVVVACSQATPSINLAHRTAPHPSGPLPGDLLIADRGNGRLLIVTPGGKIAWSLVLDAHAGWYQAPLAADDAFFTADHRQISINAEDQDVLARVDIRSRRILWTYGHVGVAGSALGYLHTPDDAYPLPNGDTLVADIFNFRILEITPDKRIVRQLGRPDAQEHNPPISFASPNGDTPLPNGDILVTEIGGSWVDRIDPAGNLVWSVHLAGIHYPSDAQLLSNGDILVVDYHSPGAVEEVRTDGTVAWRYRVTTGAGRLDHPSLAVMLPNGNVALNDDNNDRVIVIDPRTKRIVWQYGHKGVPGTAPGYLNGPDGVDFAGPNFALPPA